MNSKHADRAAGRGTLVRATVAALAAGSLAFCLVGCAADEQGQQLSASDSTSASGTTVGAYKAPEYAWVDNGAYDAQTPSAGEISGIYTFTLEGKTFTLPCAASEFADAGWAPKSDLTVAAQRYWSASAANGFVLSGADGKMVGLHLVNTGSADTSWENCQVVGIAVDGNSGVAFQTAAGVKVGDSYADVQKAYGATAFDVDNFGTMGWHFAAASDASKDGNRWYGQSIDTLSVTPTDEGLYPNWSDDDYVYGIRLENFGAIAATE